MDVREKLVERLRDVANLTPPICNFEQPEDVQILGKNITVCCKPFEQFQELLREAADYIAHGVTVQELDGCEYCNGLPFSQMEDFTMPNASKKDYDIVTIRFCPMCGRRLPQPPKGE